MFKQITPQELRVPEQLPLPQRRDWRIGVVGLGSIARGAHLPAYHENGWPVVAVADPEPAIREVARKQFGIEHVYESYRELVADEAVEVIDLCTQPILREEVVAAAAEAGKHVITEKPFGLSLEECRRMVEIAEEAGIKLAVHQNYRWMRMNYIAHDLIQRGFIGKPFFASIEIQGRQDVSLADHEYYSQCEDFLTKQWDNHLADLLRYWTGKDAKRVLARTSRMQGQNFRSDNLLTVLTDFGPGLMGHTLHSELLRSSMEATHCRVDGDQGSLVFDFHHRLMLESTQLRGGPQEIDVSSLYYTNSHAGSMADFLIAIERDQEPSVSGRRNLATICTILAEHESAELGGVWTDCQ